MRFKIGDISKLIITRTALGEKYVGREVQIRQIGPFTQGQNYLCPMTNKIKQALFSGDYVIIPEGSNDTGIVFDWQLAKLNPDKEPASLTRKKLEETT